MSPEPEVELPARQMLAEMAEMAMDLARRVHAEAVDGTRDAQSAARAFAHISRAVRQLIALDAQMLRDAKKTRLEAERDRWRDEAEAGREHRKDELREAIHPLLRSSERQGAALYHRLEACLENEAENFFKAPLGQTVGRIAYDLDLSPDWDRWRDHPWAQDAKAAYQALNPPVIVEFADFSDLEEDAPPGLAEPPPGAPDTG